MAATAVPVELDEEALANGEAPGPAISGPTPEETLKAKADEEEAMANGEVYIPKPKTDGVADGPEAHLAQLQQWAEQTSQILAEDIPGHPRKADQRHHFGAQERKAGREDPRKVISQVGPTTVHGSLH